MTRPIKFKAWHKETKSIRKVFSIDFRHGDIEVEDFQHFSYGSDIDDFEIMQFTGIHDKDGKEIYEGDIVNFEIWGGKKRQAIIKFGVYEIHDMNDCGTQEAYGWYMGGDESYSLTPRDSESIKIIGNKFTHPELLEK